MLSVISKVCEILLCAWLYRLGGSVSKIFRRVALPMWLMVFNVFKFGTIGFLTVPLGLIVFSLPITLRGDDITKYWYNYLWLPVLGFLIGMLTFNPLSAIIYSSLYTTIVVLSNYKRTASFFRWQYCEVVFGAFLGALV